MMDRSASFAEYAQRLKTFIESSNADDAAFNRLALDLFALQFESVEIYRELCRKRGVAPGAVEIWSDIPALPTEAFKEFDVTSLPERERTAVFYSSGTTSENRSRHFHCADSLALYEASLLPWFVACFLPDSIEPRLMILTPPVEAAPNSSLARMFDTIAQRLPWWAVETVGRVRDDGAWEIDAERAGAWLRGGERPVALLGTAYSFVHLFDSLGRTPLPEGSRVLETGGYKGRSREMPKAALRQLISRRLAIPNARIVSEYGMSELSSQAYERDGVFRFPHWARARVISPETGRAVEEGATGLLRVFDLANARSVLAIQTGDLAARRGDGFELLGRAEAMEPRGCSLMLA